MPRRLHQDRSRLRVVTAVALGVLALQDFASAEANLYVEATAGYTDNLLRLPDGEADVPVALGLTGTWIETTRRLSADVEGRVYGVTYLRDNFDDEILGEFDGALTWWFVPERFAWVVQNIYDQVATDPFAPISPENRQNMNFVSTGPDMYVPLGTRTRAYFGGRYESAQYQTVDTDDQRLMGIAGIDRSLSQWSRLGGQAKTESVDFESDLRPDFDRQEVYVHYEFSREHPSESIENSEYPSLGEQQAELMVSVGYAWLSSDSSDSSAPLLRVSIARSLSPRFNLRLELANEFSDAGTAFAAGRPPEQSDEGGPVIIPQAGPYEERSGRAAIDYRRPRTVISLSIGAANQQYETIDLDRKFSDVRLTAERRMTQRLTGSASVTVSKDDYRSGGLDREDTDTEYQLGMRREIGRRSSLAIIALHASRSSDNPSNEYDETRGYVVFDYSLR